LREKSFLGNLKLMEEQGISAVELEGDMAGLEGEGKQL
jgi:hypothetical protein